MNLRGYEKGNRPVSKFAYAREVHSVLSPIKHVSLTDAFLKQEGYEDLGAQDRSVVDVREDLSTKSTPQFSAEVEVAKKV